MEKGITITIFCDDAGHVVKVTDADGKRIDEPVQFEHKPEMCLESISLFRLKPFATTCRVIDGVLTCGPGLC
jgi:flagellar biosynthesis/type III secretory pathway ATPase